MNNLHRFAHLWLGVVFGATAWGTGLSINMAPVHAQVKGGESTIVSASPLADPEALTKTLTAMDQAANQQKLSRFMRFYSPDFTHSDGLTRPTLKQAVKAFWQDYQDLNYQTQLTDWSVDPKGGYWVTTTTTITGRRPFGAKVMALRSVVKSQQRWLNGKLINQAVLSEESMLTSGERPPEVTVHLPEQVKAGDDFNFDVILDKPLGDTVLLGTALAEPVSAKGYLEQASLELEPLSAGGLFKVGQAPEQPTHEWVSAVLVQDGGMTMISRRLIVVDK